MADLHEAAEALCQRWDAAEHNRDVPCTVYDHPAVEEMREAGRAVAAALRAALAAPGSGDLLLECECGNRDTVSPHGVTGPPCSAGCGRRMTVVGPDAGPPAGPTVTCQGCGKPLYECGEVVQDCAGLTRPPGIHYVHEDGSPECAS